MHGLWKRAARMIADDQHWRRPVLVQYDERRRVATAQQRDASRQRVFAIQFQAGAVGHGRRVYLLEGRPAERRNARGGRCGRTLLPWIG